MKKEYFRATIVSIALAAAFYFAWGFYSSRYQQKNESIKVDTERLNKMETIGPPELSGSTIDGVSFNLADHQGKVTIINFWATWCAPCVEEFPSMVKMAEMYKGKLVIAAVSADQNLDDIRTFMKAFGGGAENIYVIHDPESTYAEKFGTEKLPESYIFGPDHKLRRKVASSVNWMDPLVLGYLKTLQN